MNESDVSGLLCVGMHDTERGQESYATESSKMNQDTSTMYTGHNSTSAFLEEYHISGSQPLEELRFGNEQHFELQSQKAVADSEEESMRSSPDTSSATNYDMSGMEQNLQHIYNAYDALVDKDGPVMLSPDYIVCDETYHIEPHITFSSDGIKIEYLDLDLDKMITVDWGLSKVISISCKWAQSVGSALITLFAESEAEIGNSGPARVQFSIDDPQWPSKQENIWHLERRYIEIWKDIPSDDFALEDWSIESSLFFPRQYFSGNEDFEDIIYPQGDPDAVSISKRDAELLLPETFVNDTIIDFYIKYLTTRIGSTEKRRYHFFNSFFFRKLADLDKDQGRAPEGRAAFLRVRKWTRKINIFEKDFVFIPVNFSLHWSLIVVCYPGEVLTSGDGAAKLSAKLPCILHMDSLKGSHSGLKDIIQSYLWEEWKERHPESATDNSDKFLNLRFVSLELPQQDNSFDCGLFLLHYVERFLMDVPSNFNPLKIDHFSSFLSDFWFPPAEASHKRSVIRKLIHEVVTGSLQNHPKLACTNEQLDERHESRNAEGEPAGEFLAQSCSADQAGLACTIHDDAHGIQRSTSSCLNDSEEKPFSASGGMVDSERASMVAVQNLQVPGVFLPENDTVYLSSQDEKNGPLVTELNMAPCVPEDGEVLKGSSCGVSFVEHGEVLKGSSCGVSFVEHAESLLLTLDDNQKNSSEAEVKAQDIMVSDHCSISYNSEEVITNQEYSLQRNINEVGQECYRPSQDMDSMVMIDSSKDDIGPNPEMMTGENDGSDLGENGSVTQSDVNKDVAEVKREDSPADPVTVENDNEDSVKEIDMIADNVNHSEQYVSSEFTEENADQIMEGPSTYGTNISADADEACIHLAKSEALPCEDNTTGTEIKCEDKMVDVDKDVTEVKCEDSPAVENDVKDNVKEISTTADNVNHSKQYYSSELAEGNADQIMGGTSTYGTNISADAEEDYKHSTTSRALPCDEDTTGTEAQDVTAPHEGGTSCTDSEMMTLVDRACSMKNKTIPENMTSDGNMPLLDGFCQEKDIVTDDRCTQKDDCQGTVAKRPFPGSIRDEKDIELSGDKCIQKDDVRVPHPDSLCEEKVVSGDRCMRKDDAPGTDAKRPLPDGMCENDTEVAERSIQKDNSHGAADAKKERHYKRRKVLAAESQKERSHSEV